MIVAMLTTAMHAKTLVAYYSYTNNVERIVGELRSQIDTDVIEIEPAEKGLDYAANNYALGTQLLNTIRNNPADASSYPPISPVEINIDEYDFIIIATPLWWSQMAAPFQTFLFHYGPQMSGKNIGVVVSSASSGISGVVADAERLIPEGKFIEPALWIRSSQMANAPGMISSWLDAIRYDEITSSVTLTSDESDFETCDRMICVKGGVHTISLYNLGGNKVAEAPGGQLPIGSLLPGIYIAKADKERRSITHKINIR